MPVFRPIPILTLFAIPSLVLLVVLGNWQMSRMSWKADLIEQYEVRGSVGSFAETLCGDVEGDFSPRVTAPVPLGGQSLRYYALRGAPGWILLTPVEMPACEAGAAPVTLLVETGFETLGGMIMSRPEAWRVQPMSERNLFSSSNDPDTNSWYHFDRIEMARALGLETDRLSPMWARTDDGLPASLERTPPAKHLGYALTWYGLALALIAVYVALHVGQGRLRWT
ncbi:SURF1 family protein [Maricaulis sp.]|uniref:SURF1 family protein n=1 Tax=Maricaulis sp. TaxID=1486257 RepID=UPI00262D94BB|nr:SURF1 family protein [Maricaulis sp.]